MKRQIVVEHDLIMTAEDEAREPVVVGISANDDHNNDAEGEIDPATMTIAEQLRLSSLAEESRKSKRSGGEVIQASGLAELLKQSLRSQDSSMLESVIQRGDTAMISKTLLKLSINQVIPLLAAVIKSVTTKKATKNVAPCLWLKQLLMLHGSFLAASPEARMQLRLLTETLDTRLRTFTSLLQIKGRLELLASQRRENSIRSRKHRRKFAGSSQSVGLSRRRGQHGGVSNDAVDNGGDGEAAAIVFEHQDAAAIIHESDEEDNDDDEQDINNKRDEDEKPVSPAVHSDRENGPDEEMRSDSTGEPHDDDDNDADGAGEIGGDNVDEEEEDD